MRTLDTSQAPLVNSTTYIDYLGIMAGFERLPGERSHPFAARLRKAARVSRRPDYEGLLNEICLHLGLEITPVLDLAGPADLAVTVDLLGVHLSATTESWTFSTPLQVIDVDGFWEWVPLSGIVAAINASGIVAATLLSSDALAVTLPKQQNSGLALAEPIAGQTLRLAHAGLIGGSETFNQPVPYYSYGGDSLLQFSSAPPAGLTITYRYLSTPYQILGCPANLVSLLDPQFGTLCTLTNSQLTYQAREYLQEILQRDGSYWAK